MTYSTTDLYRTKRSLIHYALPLSAHLPRPQQKFVTDMLYGILASQSLKLSDIARTLQEPSHLKNTIDRLSRHLQEDSFESLAEQARARTIPLLGSEPVILVDDTDISKPYGKSFEDLGTVRDGSSLKKTADIQKGYVCTEIVGLLANNRHPVSLFSHIYSNAQKDFVSTNAVMNQALRTLFDELAHPSTFCFDRGCDRNSLFELFVSQTSSDHRYIVRINDRRKVWMGNKRFSVSELASRRKGKLCTNVRFWNAQRNCLEQHPVTVSHVKVRLAKKLPETNLVFVYGFSEKPLLLATNRDIRGKDDVVRVLRLYLSRWRIEEYFRCKKQTFGFERFRIRNLHAINHLNQLLSMAMTWLACLSRRAGKASHFVHVLLQVARPLRETVSFLLYRLADGLRILFAAARDGPRGYFPPGKQRRRPAVEQLSLFHLLPETS